MKERRRQNNVSLCWRGSLSLETFEWESYITNKFDCFMSKMLPMLLEVFGSAWFKLWGGTEQEWSGVSMLEKKTNFFKVLSFVFVYVSSFNISRFLCNKKTYLKNVLPLTEKFKRYNVFNF